MKRIETLFAVYALALLSASCGNDDNGSGDTARTDADADAGSDTDASADSGTDTVSKSWDPRFDAFVEALQADLAASEAYGVSVAVMENGVVTFAEAFGSKDPDGLETLTPHTLMQIGSTTKQMTAAALLTKVEAGEVALDDTLEELLPELEFVQDGAWDDQITLHHLLSHQGGLVDWIPWDNGPADEQLADYSYDTFDDEFWLMNPPGAFWNYSNPNFVFAGLVTEAYDTRRWPDIMKEEIFAPLLMSRTFLRKTEVEADGDYALSYGLGAFDLQTGETGPVSMDQMPDPGWARPAGLAWTTPTQMMAWARFILDGDPDVLSDELRAEITTAQVDTLFGAGTLRYGYGMFVEDGYLSKDGRWFEMPVWEHGGNTMSFTNIFYVLPSREFAVAITASAYMADFTSSLDAAITTLVDLKAPSEPWAYTVEPAKLDDHVGTYFDPYNVGEVIVTRSGDTLLIDMPGVTNHGYKVTRELETISSDLYLLYLDGQPLDVTFIRAETEGKSTYIRNRAFVATRVNEVQNAAIPEARAMPSRNDLERFVRRIAQEPLAPTYKPRAD